MTEFHNTGYGRKFLEHDLPELVKAINKLAKAIEGAEPKEEIRYYWVDGEKLPFQVEFIKDGKGVVASVGGCGNADLANEILTAEGHVYKIEFSDGYYLRSNAKSLKENKESKV